MIITYTETVARNHSRHLTVAVCGDRATLTSWTRMGAREIGRGTTETTLEGAREIVRQHLGWGYRRQK
mgnify:CR=1 FL=1